MLGGFFVRDMKEYESYLKFCADPNTVNSSITYYRHSADSVCIISLSSPNHIKVLVRDNALNDISKVLLPKTSEVIEKYYNTHPKEDVILFNYKTSEIILTFGENKYNADFSSFPPEHSVIVYRDFEGKLYYAYNTLGRITNYFAETCSKQLLDTENINLTGKNIYVGLISLIYRLMYPKKEHNDFNPVPLRIKSRYDEKLKVRLTKLALDNMIDFSVKDVSELTELTLSYIVSNGIPKVDKDMDVVNDIPDVRGFDKIKLSTTGWLHFYPKGKISILTDNDLTEMLGLTKIIISGLQPTLYGQYGEY